MNGNEVTRRLFHAECQIILLTTKNPHLNLNKFSSNSNRKFHPLKFVPEKSNEFKGVFSPLNIFRRLKIISSNSRRDNLIINGIIQSEWAMRGKKQPETSMQEDPMNT